MPSAEWAPLQGLRDDMEDRTYKQGNRALYARRNRGQGVQGPRCVAEILGENRYLLGPTADVF